MRNTLTLADTATASPLKNRQREATRFPRPDSEQRVETSANNRGYAVI